MAVAQWQEAMCFGCVRKLCQGPNAHTLHDSSNQPGPRSLTNELHEFQDMRNVTFKQSKQNCSTTLMQRTFQCKVSITWEGAGSV